MIIELFGPPGAGKTTLANTLADRLRERGRDVKLVVSYRPAEQRLPPQGLAYLRTPAALRRLVRPMVESLAAAGHSTDPGETRATTELMRLLVPRNVVQSLRVRQYLLRLSRTWYEAALTGDIVLFDQGFVQAVYTSAQVAEVADSERIGLALDAVPEADLLIRLHAPLQILVARLAERRRRQGSIERLLDRWTNFGSLGVFDEIHELLRARGRPVICIDSTDKCSLRRGMDQVQRIMVRAEDEVSVGSGPEQGGTGL